MHKAFGLHLRQKQGNISAINITNLMLD